MVLPLESDPAEPLRYLMSWASVGLSMLLAAGTVAIRQFVGPWCFWLSVCFHAAWGLQALLVCLVMTTGMREEIETMFASNVVFGGVALRILFGAMVLAFLIESSRKGERA